MKKKIKVGIVGSGLRGSFLTTNIIAEMNDVEIIMVCDEKIERAEKVAAELKEKHGTEVLVTTNYKDIIAREDIDAVVILCAWKMHTEIAVAAMKAGKYAGVEVGGAYDISDCYRIVDTYEETGMPCMMLENCCYGRQEMMVMNMVKQGLFGEIAHCTGAYEHDLRTIDLSCQGQLHYRPLEYCSRNCDNYPTHALGPIAKTIGINRGNKMLYLTSMASKAIGLMDYWKRHEKPDSPVLNQNVKQGDIVVTNIMCANGETITLKLDTTLPRAYYSRDYGIHGTRGMYDERRKVVFLEGMNEGIRDNEAEFFEKYDHPLHAEYARLGEKAGHGGMDWLVFRAFFESVKAGIQTPIDAYDTATWMAITPLSEISIARGSAPVDIPDFTRGKWINREPALKTKYSLDEIVEDTEIAIY